MRLCGRKKNQSKERFSRLRTYVLAFAALSLLTLPSYRASGQSDQEAASSSRISTKIISSKSTRRFLDSLQKTDRETGGSRPKQRKALKMVLDVRLPRVEIKCDLKISHELFKVGYAVQAEHPGAAEQLKNIAESIDRMTESDLRGVTPGCRSELRGFGSSVLRVYLGQDWQSVDEQNRKSP